MATLREPMIFTDKVYCQNGAVVSGLSVNNTKTGSHIIIFDQDTGESLLSTYPVQYIEDFLGVAGGGPFDGTTQWNLVDVNNGAEAIVADSGVFRLALTNANEAQDAVLYHGDNRTFNLSKGLIFECRIDVAVTTGTGVAAVFGLCGDHDLDKDTAKTSAWFRLQAAASILCETDDATTDTDDKDTGLDIANGTYRVYRIDCTNLADVRFYVDGQRVCSDTRFDLSGATSTDLMVQPYFSLDKASGTGLGTLDIDYVKIFQTR